MRTLAQISTRVYDDFGRVKKAFAKFDKSGDAQISVSELQAGMRGGGYTLSDGEAQAVFEAFDTGKTGTLSYREFVLVLAAAASSA